MEESHRSFVDSLLGERIAGRYIVERVVRSGGMGVVAAARYPELHQEVAIKFMLPELAVNPTLSARFLREARLAARVKSPHFVRVFDFGKLDTGVPYLVMEMLTGHDLRDELDARGALPTDLAVDYVLQAVLGLAEVHALGIVHRDLKPSNLFLSEAAGAETIKVLDFGVSKDTDAATGTALTSTGNLVGTPLYMSPEQVKESKTVDVRSDVWSLGVILYELLTDALPFGGDGEAIGEIYGLILHTDPVPLRSRKADLSSALEEVVHTCLKREPGERFADVGQLANALRPFASAASAARISAVHRALASTGRRVTSEDPPAFAKAPAEPTAESSPNAKRHASPIAPAVPELSSRAGRETGMTASRASEVATGRRRRPAIPLIAGAAIVAALAVLVVVLVSWRAASVSSLAAPPPAPPAELTASSTAMLAPPRASSEPSATASALAVPVPTSRRSPSASAPSLPVHAKRKVAPPLAPSAVPSAAPEDLLLDRK